MNFPHEGFVQSTIEEYFKQRGFMLDVETHADLVCAHLERWLIEAKGVTSEVGLDFRTGLGQLLQRMTDQSVQYAMAVPDVEVFLGQCRLVSAWVRERLGLHWLIVGENGSVRKVAPSELITERDRTA